MPSVKSFIKGAFASLGLTVARRDRLAEQIPSNYLRSPYLPPIYRHSVARLIYFHEMFQRIHAMPGDIVECGVSIGAGILNWALLTELSGARHHVIGFDSFAGFPTSTEMDRKRDGGFQTHAGDYASPPELVLKILEDGQVSPDFVRTNVHLVRGYFDATLDRYDGRIALLHLDCDLYTSYKVCLEKLYAKMNPGGIIMFDEYEDVTFPGAKVAVDEFFEDKPEKPIRFERYEYCKYYVIKA